LEKRIDYKNFPRHYLIIEYIHSSRNDNTEIESLKLLTRYASQFHFHFDVLVHIIRLLPQPNTILNKILPEMYKHLLAPPKDFPSFPDHLRTSELDLIYKLVSLSSALKLLAMQHPLERMDILEHYNNVEKMLSECTVSDCMDESSIVRDVLIRNSQSKAKEFINKRVELAQVLLIELVDKLFL
jgi:hypothetical protein